MDSLNRFQGVSTVGYRRSWGQPGLPFSPQAWGPFSWSFRDSRVWFRRSTIPDQIQPLYYGL